MALVFVDSSVEVPVMLYMGVISDLLLFLCVYVCMCVYLYVLILCQLCVDLLLILVPNT